MKLKPYYKMSAVHQRRNVNLEMCIYVRHISTNDRVLCFIFVNKISRVQFKCIFSEIFLTRKLIHCNSE